MCKQQLQQFSRTKATAKIMNTTITEEEKQFECCGLDQSCPVSVTAMPSQHVRLDQYQSSITTKTRKLQSPSTVVPDHEFEWYDLDVIREVDNANNSFSDFNAGLVFTTERQVLNQGAEINTATAVVGKSQQKFDLFSWAGDLKKVAETRDEREFRERMEELEQEINGDSSSSSLTMSFSSLRI